MIKNKNQSAFPLNGHKWQDDIGRGFCSYEYDGLSKRELFAAMAMQGLLSNSHYISNLESNMRTGAILDANSMCVRESLDIADELLKQLES